jgi:TfoX/Sxy family transcriptional regulator of competence genes
MAYDEHLADRIRAALAKTPNVSERKMFGGLAFMVAGHMACGIVGNDLMLRLGQHGANAALDEPHTRPMDFTGKPMKSMVYVARPRTETDAALLAWVKRATAHARTLPPKQHKSASTWMSLRARTQISSAAPDSVRAVGVAD